MTAPHDPCDEPAGAQAPPRVLVLVVYFGAWPEYFPLYLESCARNKSVDFLFITDCGRTETIDALPNCRSVTTTLAEVEARARRRLADAVRIPTAYKLCDLKPAYGDLFAEHLAGYDYWGWTDIDLVYGDLRTFLGDLAAYDSFFVNRLWVSGVFGLLRNTDTLRRLYRRSADWEQAFAAPDYVGFDECGRMWSEVVRAGSVEPVSCPLDTFTHVIQRHAREGGRTYGEQLVYEGRPGTLRVADDIADARGRRYVLFHFVTAKSGWAFVYPRWRTIPAVYWITRRGFFAQEPRRGATLRMLCSPNAMGQIARKLGRRLRTAGKRLARGDVRFVWSDVVRRARGG